ncbi:MAG: PadR family transcriptional regulator [Actinomycetota bacterium]|nr:PadR family transcriptional regulator [Actinomycetota bacterium]
MGFFRYGELPLVILALLARNDMNGYELMAALERAFRSEYLPSPGSIYPALNALRREKLVAAERDGTTKRYSLTEAGGKALIDRSEQLSAIELRTDTFLRDEADVLAELARLDSTVRSAQRIVEPDLIRGILHKARKSLSALIEEGE